MTTRSLSRRLGSLGIPSDLEVIADAGTIGRFFSRARSTVWLVGVVASTDKPPYSKAYYVDLVDEGSDGRGLAVASKIMSALEKMPVPLDKAALAARLALTCGDGAVAMGGEDPGPAQGGGLTRQSHRDRH